MLRSDSPGLRLARCAALFAIALASTAAAADAPHQSVSVDATGTIHADGLVVPPSEMLSPAAQRESVARLTQPQPQLTGGIPAARLAVDAANRPMVERWRALYPSTIRSVVMNGIRTDVVTPERGVAPENAHRVLISLHGGGFFAGSGQAALVEAVPVSGQGRVTVVSVEYRLAPENRFPAASEDVEKVYRKLLETYKPENIGIYGCSAGGTLVAQSVAWFQQKHLPRPGAIGIFCSGAMPGFWYGGDSLAISALLNGFPMPTAEQIKNNPGALYLAGTDQHNPLITPGLFPEVLAKFPPTLLLTGTRDNSMSNALLTNVALLKAGVDTQLLVLEGIGHSEFNMMAGTPEATDTFDLVWRFFDKHLGR